jgi:hypothetical protein
MYRLLLSVATCLVVSLPGQYLMSMAVKQHSKSVASHLSVDGSYSATLFISLTVQQVSGWSSSPGGFSQDSLQGGLSQLWQYVAYLYRVEYKLVPKCLLFTSLVHADISH